MNKYSMALVFALLAGCIRGGSDFAVVKIYYVPIGAETIIAVTEQNIEQHCQVCGEKQVSAIDLDRIGNAVLGAPNGSFNESRVRLKMVSPDGTVLLIDNDGGVKSSSSGAPKALSKQELTWIGNFMEDLGK